MNANEINKMIKALEIKKQICFIRLENIETKYESLETFKKLDRIQLEIDFLNFIINYFHKTRNERR